MPRFSKRSDKELKTCDIRIQLLFNEVVKHYDCKILEGYRSEDDQLKLYESKLSKIKKSKHNLVPSLAVDATPYPIPIKWGESDVKEMFKFYHFAGFVKGIAKAQNLDLRWGGDWDSDNDFNDQTFNDLLHFEIKI